MCVVGGRIAKKKIKMHSNIPFLLQHPSLIVSLVSHQTFHSYYFPFFLSQSMIYSSYLITMTSDVNLSLKHPFLPNAFRCIHPSALDPIFLVLNLIQLSQAKTNSIRNMRRIIDVKSRREGKKQADDEPHGFCIWKGLRRNEQTGKCVQRIERWRHFLCHFLLLCIYSCDSWTFNNDGMRDWEKKLDDAEVHWQNEEREMNPRCEMHRNHFICRCYHTHDSYGSSFLFLSGCE